MIRRGEDQKITQNTNMRGGDGTVTITAMLNPDELYGKGRLFSRITLEPGCSIGYHVHENEMEAFYVLTGVGDYNDNGQETRIAPGDSTLTLSGEGHSVANNGDDTLELVALIVYK
jgi:quercetin dioxygenase-like cupin family protein